MTMATALENLDGAVEWLQVLVILAEDLNSVSNTHMMAHNCLSINSVLGNLMPSPAFCVYKAYMWYINIHAGKTPMLGSGSGGRQRQADPRVQGQPGLRTGSKATQRNYCLEKPNQNRKRILFTKLDKESCLESLLALAA